MLAGNTLYVAAQDGRKAATAACRHPSRKRSSSPSTIMRQVLQAAGMDLGNLVWVQVYVTRTEDIAAMNDVYWKSIGANPPARTCWWSQALPGGEKVQINAIAVASSAQRQVITPAGWPHGRPTDPAGIQVDDVLYISAQSGADPKTGKLPADYSRRGETEPGQCRRRAEGRQHDHGQCALDQSLYGQPRDTRRAPPPSSPITASCNRRR